MDSRQMCITAVSLHVAFQSVENNPSTAPPKIWRGGGGGEERGRGRGREEERERKKIFCTVAILVHVKAALIFAIITVLLFILV